LFSKIQNLFSECLTVLNYNHSQHQNRVEIWLFLHRSFTVGIKSRISRFVNEKVLRLGHSVSLKSVI
jgi:hypothetical protein